MYIYIYTFLEAAGVPEHAPSTPLEVSLSLFLYLPAFSLSLFLSPSLLHTRPLSLPLSPSPSLSLALPLSLSLPTSLAEQWLQEHAPPTPLEVSAPPPPF